MSEGQPKPRLLRKVGRLRVWCDGIHHARGIDTKAPFWIDFLPFMVVTTHETIRSAWTTTLCRCRRQA